jgi:hypothetical protein
MCLSGERAVRIAYAVVVLPLLSVAVPLACDRSPQILGFLPADADAAPDASGGLDAATGSFGDGSSSGGAHGGCPPGLQCNVPCSGGATTTISGKVYDPAQKNPLYNVTVFVPENALQSLPKGIPTGADACSCTALYKSGAVVSTTTGADGSFKLTNAPVGSAVPLVLQIGKWRKLVTIPMTSCQDNPQADKSLALPGTIPAGDTNDNMPDIAVSTGSSDTLECLMTRIGLPTTEYVAGPGGTGHIHVFSGGDPTPTSAGGTPEKPPMMGAPESDTNLWDSQAHLMPYDITLLSCEGAETYNAKPQILEDYLNAGGRVFASHYQYAWFTPPIGSGQSYMPPPDWGNNLATWTVGTNGGAQSNGKIVQTLNGSTMPFVKGQALFQWLSLNGALGVLNAPAMELPVIPPRYNAMVGPANKPSQSWINDDTTGNAIYFSFDTPVNAMPQPDGGAPNYCGRAVFSGLHVSGETIPADTNPPPGGCMQADLSPQEKVLEFMLFDLSSCVIPDTVPPSLPVQ